MVLDERGKIADILLDLDDLGPSGFAVALYLGHASPAFLFKTYASRWSDEYSRRGLMTDDPTIRWGLANTGSTRWSDLAAIDHAGVLDQADRYGLSFGATISVQTDQGRSLASFARADREYTDAEIATLTGAMTELHALTNPVMLRDSTTQRALTEMSIRMTRR